MREERNKNDNEMREEKMEGKVEKMKQNKQKER